MVIWLYLGVIQKKSDVVALAKVSWSSAYAVTLAEGRITLNYSSTLISEGLSYIMIIIPDILLILLLKILKVTVLVYVTVLVLIRLRLNPSSEQQNSIDFESQVFYFPNTFTPGFLKFLQKKTSKPFACTTMYHYPSAANGCLFFAARFSPWSPWLIHRLRYQVFLRHTWECWEILRQIFLKN